MRELLHGLSSARDSAADALPTTLDYAALPREELRARIERRKDELNAVILGHNYQRVEIQEVSDYLGDSLGLSQEAADTNADVIVFCGVHFMAETAKILSPGKTVLMPDLKAGCPMADFVTAGALKRLMAEYPDAAVVTYVNSTAEVKAESDICCTSSNAVSVVESIPRERPIIFVPDRNLARYVQQRTGRDNIIAWDGYCYVHDDMVIEELDRAKKAHPDAVVVVHPEARRELLDRADVVTSTSGMVDVAAEHDVVIFGTERGLVDRMHQQLSREDVHSALGRRGVRQHEAQHAGQAGLVAGPRAARGRRWTKTSGSGLKPRCGACWTCPAAGSPRPRKKKRSSSPACVRAGAGAHDPMNVRTFTGGGFGENGYLVVCEGTGAAVIVDPGAAAAAMAGLVASEGLDLQAVLLTHAHLDHVEGVHHIRALAPDAPLWLHPADRALYDALGDQAAMFGLGFTPQPPPDEELEHGQRFTFGSCAFEVRHAPGHSPGHVILVGHEAGLALVGDVIFQAAIGRTDLPGGDFYTLMRSIREQVLTLPDETVLHPGHGPSTTVGFERVSNPFLIPHYRGEMA